MFNFISKWCNKAKDKTSENQSQIEYVTLTPDDEIANGAEYLKALKWAIESKKAKNIALSGPYGSGKSSVIETFLKNNPSIKNRSIKISMATFIEEILIDEEKTERKKIELNKDEIEKGILKQLFYKVEHRKIPQSRYRKLHRINFWHILLAAVVLFLAFMLVGYVFWPSILTSVVDKIAVAGSTIKLPRWASKIVAGLFVFGCLAALSWLYRTIWSKFNVKEVKLPKDISFQRNTENQDSIFNRNMDEIVYFFEETKYNTVFFEDLDRLNNASIFVNLRELNIILNNYDAIKDPIVFVYAVKDDVFTDVDRTKFFDFIIPIVPIINSTNSGEILLKKLKKSNEIKKVHNVSESFVMDVSPYIADMRILQNIYNEFIIYKNTLATGQNLTLLDEPMLALIIFKNLYPSDFADLQMESGIVKQAFKGKDKFIKNKCKELQERIDSTVEVLENINTEIFRTRKSLKYAFLCEITNDTGFAISFTPSGKHSISASKFLEDDYVIPDLLNINSCSGSYVRWNGNGSYSFSCLNFGEIYDKFINRYKSVSLIEDKKIEEEKASVETIKHEIYKLSSKSLSELIENYSIDDILSTDVRSNALLVFLLRRGYINEKYVDYINYFKATSITTGDMNYILGIKNLSPKSFTYKLSKIDLIINRLQLYEFEQEAIYNFDLLEHLLGSDKYNDKLNLFIKQLSNGSENSWKFIDEFIDTTEQKQRFISILANKWNNMWDSIFNNSVITLNRKFEYLSLLILYCSIDLLKSMDVNGNLTAFLVNNSDVLQRLSFIDDKRIIDIISSLNIKFVDIQTQNVSATILDYIFDNNFYIINFNMIQHVVEHKNKELVSFLKTKNYSTLQSLGYTPLLKYVEKNINLYTDEIVLSAENTEENIDAIIKLLKLNVGSKNRCIQIIVNENFYVDDITTFCLDMWEENRECFVLIWNTIISNGKLKPTWQNFKNYWEYLGHTDTSINYMCKNVEVLMEDDSTCIDDEAFIKEFINFDIEQACFAKLLRKLPWDGFDIQLNTLDEEKISTMINLRYLKFTVERYNELSEDFPDLCFEFIVLNQYEYMLVRDEINIDSKIFELLIFDKRFARSNAQCLLDDYGAKYMTSKIAQNIISFGFNINIDIYNAAWKLLDNNGKENLMFSHLDLLDSDSFETCFTALGGEYAGLSDRLHRHEVSLSDTEKNLKLAQRLKEIGYITSYQVKSVKESDKAKLRNKTINKIVCRVKQSN